MKKSLIIGVLALALLVGGTGCMNQPNIGSASESGKNPSSQSSKNLIDVALTYMEEKYGQEFSYDAPWGDSLSGDYSFLATCPALPGKQVVVVVKNFRSDNKVFCDNYLAVKHEEETLAYLQSCVDEIYGTGSARAFRDILKDPLSPDLPVNATMEDVLADTSVWQNLVFEVKESSFTSNEQVAQLTNLLAKSGADFRMSVIFLADNECGSDNYEALLDRIVDRRFSRCAIVANVNKTIDIRWVEKE